MEKKDTQKAQKKKSQIRAYSRIWLWSLHSRALLSKNANLQTCWRGIHTSKYASIFCWRLQLLKARVFAVSSTNAHMRSYLTSKYANMRPYLQIQKRHSGQLPRSYILCIDIYIYIIFKVDLLAPPPPKMCSYLQISVIRGVGECNSRQILHIFPRKIFREVQLATIYS
jgi:hypothetical protein